MTEVKARIKKYILHYNAMRFIIKTVISDI